MKYIYFDCFSGFDVQMALGSLIDMCKNESYAKNAVKILAPDCNIISQEVKRQSMDALLVNFDFEIPQEEDINVIIDNSDFEDELKSRLKLWYKFKSDGKIRPFEDEFRELMYCAACIATIDEIGADKIYISALNQGDAVVNTGTQFYFVPSKHTELLQKMVNVPVFPTNAQNEILTPGALALMYVSGFEHMSPRAHNVIESGYGAGKDDTAVPNLARCILAVDETDEKPLEMECVLENSYAFSQGTFAESK